MSVYRIFVEKRPGLSPEAESLLGDLRGFLGIEALQGLRILNRYDVEHIDPAVFAAAGPGAISNRTRRGP